MPAGVAGLALALHVYPHHQGVLVAIDQKLDHFEAIAASRALLPKLLARARPEPGDALLDRTRKRLLVHVREHEHVALGVGDDATDQAAVVEARGETDAVLEVGAGESKTVHDRLLPDVGGQDCHNLSIDGVEGAAVAPG